MNEPSEMSSHADNISLHVFLLVYTNTKGTIEKYVGTAVSRCKIERYIRHHQFSVENHIQLALLSTQLHIHAKNHQFALPLSKKWQTPR